MYNSGKKNSEFQDKLVIEILSRLWTVCVCFSPPVIPVTQFLPCLNVFIWFSCVALIALKRAHVPESNTERATVPNEPSPHGVTELRIAAEPEMIVMSVQV